MSTIVLVEEVQLVRYNLKHRLYQMGYNVYDFENVQSLLANPKVLKYVDLLLLSVNHSGEEALRDLRTVHSNPQMENIPIFFVSADHRVEFIQQVAKLGVIDYMYRPFLIEDIVLRIKKFLPVLLISMTVEGFLEMELERAKRGSYPVSVLLVEVDDKQLRSSSTSLLGLLGRIKNDCSAVFRKVDMLLEYGNSMLLICPFAPSVAIPVIQEKVVEAVSHYEEDIKSRIRLSGVSYPECTDHNELLAMLRNRLASL